MFKVPPSEIKVVKRLFTYSLLIASSYVVARTVGDSLFLSRVGNEQLALVFVLAGFATALFAGVWYLATRHLSISKTIQISGLAFAGLTLVAWAVLPAYHHSFWLLAAIYLLAEVKGCINAINIVSALNSKLGRDACKPSWAAIGLAAPIAAVIAGSVFATEYSLLSLRSWLLLSVLLDLGACAIGVLLAKTPAVGAASKSAGLVSDHRPVSTVMKTRKIYVRSDKFRFWIGVLISAQVIALTIVSFEWKTSVNTYFQSNPDNLVRFFGIYYGAVGVATIVFQLIVTSPLLVRRNLALPVLLMPVVLLAVGFSFLVGAGLLIALFASTIGKSLEVWRRSVQDTTINLLYTKIKRDRRRAAIALNSAVVKPMAEVLAAGVIFVGASVVYRPLFIIVLLVWIFAAVRLIRLVKPASRFRANASESPDAKTGAKTGALRNSISA